MEEDLNILDVGVEKVYQVYSGKPGCACGCRGKHTYASAVAKNGLKARGYELKADEVNDRTVNLIFNKMKKAAAAGEPVKYVEPTPGFTAHFSWETDTRSYVVYLLPLP